MDEAHLVNANFRNEFKNFCDKFLKGVEQEWTFFEYNVVACINNVFHDWENGRKEVSRLQSLANQIKEYQVPPAGQFPGHQEPQPIYRQPSPKFKDCQVKECVSGFAKTHGEVRSFFGGHPHGPRTWPFCHFDTLTVADSVTASRPAAGRTPALTFPSAPSRHARGPPDFRFSCSPRISRSKEGVLVLLAFRPRRPLVRQPEATGTPRR